MTEYNVDSTACGRGDVISVEGSGDGCMTRIRFRDSDEKVLLLKFARFTVVGR